MEDDLEWAVVARAERPRQRGAVTPTEANKERLHGIVAGLCPPGVGVSVEHVIARREWAVRLCALDRRGLPHTVEIRYDAEDEAPTDKPWRRVAVRLDADALRDGVQRLLEMLAVAIGHPGCWGR